MVVRMFKYTQGGKSNGEFGSSLCESVGSTCRRGANRRSPLTSESLQNRFNGVSAMGTATSQWAKRSTHVKRSHQPSGYGKRPKISRWKWEKIPLSVGISGAKD